MTTLETQDMGELHHEPSAHDLEARIREINLRFFVESLNTISNTAEEVTIEFGEEAVEGAHEVAPKAPYTVFVFKMGTDKTTPTPKYLEDLGRRMALDESATAETDQETVVSAYITAKGQAMIVGAPISVNRTVEIFKGNPPSKELDPKLASALNEASNRRAEEVHQTFRLQVLNRMARAIRIGESERQDEV